jgi:hypothetical protein
LASSGRRVVVQCVTCPNRKLLKPTDLGVPLTTAVALAGAVMKCGDCGSTEVSTYPESNRDARKGRVR